MTTTDVKQLDLFKILKSIQGATDTSDFYQFLIADLKEKIETHNKNSVYWLNQISFLRQQDEPMKDQIKSYHKMVNDNDKVIKRYKKAHSLLKKSLKHTNKGDKS